MYRYQLILRCALFFAAALLANPAHASFHDWDITEVYTNADGSVQFVELFTSSPGQQLLNNRTLKATSTVGGTPTDNTFTFPNHLSLQPPNPDSTANQHMLIATTGFGGLAGGVTPDYTLDAGGPFFNPNADSVTINFANFDSVTFALAPTDGTSSLNYPGATVATNSPTNFAGDAGSLLPLFLAGDYNDDNKVDAADYTAWRNNLGAPADTLPNDVDGGEIGAAQYTTWKNNFGAAGSAALTSDAVPEPATGVILVLAAVSLLGHWSNLRSNTGR